VSEEEDGGLELGHESVETGPGVVVEWIPLLS
jgi:hypothetical protein